MRAPSGAAAFAVALAQGSAQAGDEDDATDAGAEGTAEAYRGGKRRREETGAEGARRRRRRDGGVGTRKRRTGGAEEGQQRRKREEEYDPDL